MTALATASTSLVRQQRHHFYRHRDVLLLMLKTSMSYTTVMSHSQSQPVVAVAAGILQLDDGQILLASRPADKPWPGYWEFPGGKIEPGESAAAALSRELHEELGIQVTRARPWITLRHQYQTACIHLHCFVVEGWEGTPIPREGQTLRWQIPHEVQVEPLLPANRRLLDAFNLPAMMGISPATGDIATFVQRAGQALAGGLRLIQLRRDHPHDLTSLATQLTPLAHQHGARILINSDIELAQSCGADGVHLKASQLRELATRPDIGLVGASCHNAEELALADRLGCDYVLLSPVLATRSHPDRQPLGWDAFTRLANGLPMPVYALGGMQPSLLATARQHGAHGIAMLGAAWP